MSSCRRLRTRRSAPAIEDEQHLSLSTTEESEPEPEVVSSSAVAKSARPRQRRGKRTRATTRVSAEDAVTTEESEPEATPTSSTSRARRSKRLRATTTTSAKASENSATSTLESVTPMPTPDPAMQPSTSSTVTPTETDVCSVCLDPPVHPVTLACSHAFCFLCAKGLSATGQPCSLCRAPIDPGYLKRPGQLQRTHSDLRRPDEGEGEGEDQWQWFYEGRQGWWKFERRQNEDIEEAFRRDVNQLDLLICGHLYTIDYSEMAQYRKDSQGRRRKIKRDVVFAACKGVAGLVVKGSQPAVDSATINPSVID